MKAVLIAGGFGTRLRPLTLTRPKHLLPIVNRPHLHHVFDLLQKHGMDELILSTSYLAESFEDAIRTARSMGMHVEVAHEEEALGTAGALKNAGQFLEDETFFAFNGDVLTDMDLTAALLWHRSKNSEATIVLTPVDDPSAYGVVPTDPDGRVLGFIEKPPAGEAPTNLINAGVYILERSVLDRIPDGEVYSAERALFPGLVAEGAPMYAMGTDAYWMDIGTPEKYRQANMDTLTGAFRTDLVTDPGEAANIVAEDAQVAGSLTRSAVGAKASVGEGATVQGSVLLPSAEVGAGAEVIDCILGEGATVAPGTRLTGQTLGDGESVGPNDIEETT